MAWKIYDESVDMVTKRHQYFPRAFRWRGQRWEVETVERRWTVGKSGLRGHRERHYFQVRCKEGVFELYQEIRTGTWHLRRAKLSPRRAAAWSRVASAWQ